MTDTPKEETTRKPPRRLLKGTVVSDKMDKTLLVRVDRRRQHPLYGKIMKLTKKYMVHDYKEEAGIGDFVLIEETRPLSKNKRFRLVEVLEKAK
ncbi:MAG TPA: 30S ribosomal protein S17 [bacterium]|jgi:small subunit ribosomal protein S17